MTLLPQERLRIVAEAFGATEGRRPGYWQANCPVHDDSRPSLEIWLRGDKVCFGCWVCTPPRTPGAVEIKKRMLAAVGLTWADVMGESDRPKISRRIVKVYPYTDESGRLLYQTVRYEPKDFRQWRPDGRGGWIHNLDGVRRVLYRLPELHASGDGRREGVPPVYIVEGEKDADSLCALGLTATTRALGSKSPWLPDYTIALYERHVAIIADSDLAGIDGAAMVAGQLVAVGAALSVAVIRIPTCKDVTDWLTRDGLNAARQRERLELLTASATTYRRH